MERKSYTRLFLWGSATSALRRRNRQDRL